ncbi:MAG: radical SAM protein [Ruminococcaceae bacterium]|nr:radical SAM protein [Oscillospiraceae bacterium]
MNEKITCQLCPHYCKLSEGQIGLCGARQAKLSSGSEASEITEITETTETTETIEAPIKTEKSYESKEKPLKALEVVPLNYGKVTSFALDPIEKKPLLYFHPGANILSVGGFGCNMSCPFCQNYHIASRGRKQDVIYDIPPEQLITLANSEKRLGNIGIAFTYNEPLIAFEYVLDTAKLAQNEGLEIVLVTNGQINEPYLKQLLPYVSAWNIDLKCFSEETYKKLGGDFNTVLKTIELAQATSHVEITTLVVPKISDNEDEMYEMAKFLASLNPDIPLHLSRYFPCYKYDEPATDINKMKKLKEIASKHLNRVRLGNM